MGKKFFHLHRARDDVLLHVEPEEGLQRFPVGGYAVEERIIAKEHLLHLVQVNAVGVLQKETGV